MDDIYRNFIFDNKSKTATDDARSSMPIRRQEKPVHEDYVEGDVTGYAEQYPMHVIE